MGENIQIKNPQEVMACVSFEADLLKQYLELVSCEERNLSLLESLICETINIVNSRKQGVLSAIEQTKLQENTEAKKQALWGLQKKFEQYEEQARSAQLCNNELISIRHDYMAMVNECTAIADTGKILSGKILMLINKIIEAL